MVKEHGLTKADASILRQAIRKKGGRGMLLSSTLIGLVAIAAAYGYTLAFPPKPDRAALADAAWSGTWSVTSLRRPAGVLVAELVRALWGRHELTGELAAGASPDSTDSSPLVSFPASTSLAFFACFFGAESGSAGRGQRRPAICGAASQGSVKYVRLLLDAGAAVDKRTADGWTALGMAVFEGKLEVAQLLLERGAAVDAPALDGRTPLAAAAQKADLQVILPPLAPLPLAPAPRSLARADLPLEGCGRRVSGEGRGRWWSGCWSTGPR